MIFFFDVEEGMLELDFQFSLCTLGAQWTKNLHRSMGFEFGFGLAKNTPSNHVLIFKCKLRNTRTRLFPIIFENVIFI